MLSTRLLSRRRQDHGAKWAKILIAVFSTIGLVDTTTITLKFWGFLGDLICPSGSNGCNDVINSPWGTVLSIEEFTIPLSVIGILAYGSVLLLAVISLLPVLNKNKSSIPRISWWGIFLISVCMAIFSSVLVGLMIFKIKAYCFFCVLSAVLSFLILIMSITGGGWEDYRNLAFRGILLGFAVLVFGLIWSSLLDPDRISSNVKEAGIPPAVTTKSSTSSLRLAEHLTSAGVVMYSAYWCPHCHDQKQLFGEEATKALEIVECATDGQNNNAKLCREKKLEGFPSWEINQFIESGVKSLKELADLTDYTGPNNF